ncbi:hypothetical protein FC83_GL000909 [Agrilactobacillus composti DSM 18527 = JCM 14202]|uniref:Uncharacterized protein n=1 Tax=Agrilactobacillus composti DSM 18527 = JCM 14202 TaxID=1423734 RepID=X0PGS1_9LACO|nr:hypothetical protein FC83_GL000909 [Agrilactobacillus composti DSM 18527 = JCM 14202]GAF41123.1 hypothetical protein JCM14202_3047 [Agrilactobacillus composti DSM 18527 = JCM 14202]
MNEFHWPPSVWIALSVREKALVISGIDIRIAEEKKQQKEAERKARAKAHK